jgi:tRNA threonylcarbamoyl adenosine modification protein (Sua5/YciO/YrdC/YwlC family)
MMRRFSTHPQNPHARVIAKAVEMMNQGALAIYPTDATYALGCRMDALDALARLRMIRNLDKDHALTLICKDLSHLAHYASVNNYAFRLLKKYTPGPFTFILPASPALPRRLSDPKRKTIGLRIPDNKVTLALLNSLEVPLFSTTVQLPDDEFPMTDPDLMEERLNKQVDLLIDAGAGDIEPTTIIDLTKDSAQIIRLGKGVFLG